MKKVGVLLIAICMLFTLVGCSGPVGYWQIQEIVAGDVTMNNDDAESIGLNMLGAFKLQKSGKCVLNLLGEETEGTWSEAEDGTIKVEGSNGSIYLGSIDEENVMLMTDEQGVQYRLKK